MSTLWLMLVPVCTAIYTLLLPIAPNDFWYHVRAGAWICENGALPTVAMFSSAAPPQTPYFYQSWIAEVVMYKVLAMGGLDWIEILRTLCLTAAFALLQFTVWRRCGRIAPHMEGSTRARIAALITLLAFAMAASNMDIRPQTFSAPLFSLFVFLLLEWPFREGKFHKSIIATIALLMLLWVNTHGAFFTGFILVTLYCIGEFLQAALSKKPKIELLFGKSSSSQSLQLCAVMALLAAAATLVNQRGPAIYAYIWMFAGLEAGQKFIQEWQAPSLDEWYGVLFFAALALFLILFVVVISRSKSAPAASNPVGAAGIRLSELLIVAALAVMALRDIRSIIWFALFAAPLLASMISRLAGSKEAKKEEPVPRAAQLINAVILVMLAGSFFPFLPWFKTSIPMPPDFLSHFAPNPKGNFPIGFQNDPPLLLDRDNPVEAVAALSANPPQGKVWNDFVYGSYLVWATRYEPRLAPWADPRVEMHPFSFWKEYGRLCEGPSDAALTLKRGNFTDALLDKREQPKLKKRLEEAGWKTMFARGNSVWLRAPLAPK